MHEHHATQSTSLFAWLFHVFTPRRVCMEEQADVIAMHLLSDAVIALAYFSIPLALVYFVRRRPDVGFPAVFRLFAAFILLCGTTHVLGVIAIWAPPYRLDGYVKAATALVSIATAVQLWRVAPTVLSLASPAQLRAINDTLRNEVSARVAAQEAQAALATSLETRVRERTRELEAASSAREDALRELTERNRDLDQFAYVASHDLRAPLRGISNLSQWIEDDVGDTLPPKSREHLRLLAARVERMDALIDGILHYSRAGRVRGAQEAVDPADVAREVAQMLATDRVRIGAVPKVLADRVELQQVLLNLVGNALKHAPTGPVEISGERTAGGLVEIVVRDHGPGIEARFHERIFGLFQTLAPRDEVEGSGIGLAVVKKLVEGNGGAIRLESSLGAGAAFCFTWPAAPEGVT